MPTENSIEPKTYRDALTEVSQTIETVAEALKPRLAEESEEYRRGYNDALGSLFVGIADGMDEIPELPPGASAMVSSGPDFEIVDHSPRVTHEVLTELAAEYGLSTDDVLEVILDAAFDDDRVYAAIIEDLRERGVGIARQEVPS
ncbi:MAG: hypothetical protein KC636_32755 [Myxococcales bacterium]|nr:hypothetical protein [Myxococcales bacterium]